MKLPVTLLLVAVGLAASAASPPVKWPGLVAYQHWQRTTFWRDRFAGIEKTDETVEKWVSPAVLDPGPDMLHLQRTNMVRNFTSLLGHETSASQERVNIRRIGYYPNEPVTKSFAGTQALSWFTGATVPYNWKTNNLTGQQLAGLLQPRFGQSFGYSFASQSNQDVEWRAKVILQFVNTNYFDVTARVWSTVPTSSEAYNIDTFRIPARAWILRVYPDQIVGFRHVVPWSFPLYEEIR